MRESYNQAMNKKTATVKFDNVLPSHMQLDIWEVYARLVLRYIDMPTYGRLSHGDKPDLRDGDLDLGVEVTQALPSCNQEADALFAKLRHGSNELNRTRIIERIEQLGGTVSDYGLFGPNGKNDFDRVIDAFKEKLAKLNGRGYETFGHNHLFIRSDIHADNMMLDEGLTSFVALNTQPSFFERVIVSVPGHNYDFNLNNQTFRDLTFESDDQFEIAEKARSIVIEAEIAYAAK